MDIQDIKIEDMGPNDYNPNIVPDETMVSLRKAIEREGFLQPLILKKDPRTDGKYIIIDGEHRYNAMKEIGAVAIPSIVVEREDDMSKILTVTMNKFRGTFDSLKLASLLSDLRKEYSDDQIQDFLGFSSEELDGFADVADYDFNRGSSDEELENEKNNSATMKQLGEEDTIPFSIEVTREQKDIIFKAIDEFGGNEVSGLIGICREVTGKNIN